MVATHCLDELRPEFTSQSPQRFPIGVPAIAARPWVYLLLPVLCWGPCGLVHLTL